MLFQTLLLTLQSRRLLGILYALSLLVALPSAIAMFLTINTESHDSLALLSLLNGFDYTTYSDFMQQHAAAIWPLIRTGWWTGILYILVSSFTAGGILGRFAHTPGEPFNVGTFWQLGSRYIGRFLGVVGIELLFILPAFFVFLLIGILVGLAFEDTMTEPGIAGLTLTGVALWIGVTTLIVCIGDYTRVRLFHSELGVFRAFSQSFRMVLKNLGNTFGNYWLIIATGAGLFGLYFLVDSLITAHNWPTILIMFVVQQAFIVVRVILKVWTLGTACVVYERLPTPIILPIQPIDGSPTITDEGKMPIVPEP